MAQFDFNSGMSTSGSNLNLNGVSLGYHHPGDLFYSSRANGTGIYSGRSSEPSVGVTASVNNVPVYSNVGPSVYGSLSGVGSNRGSNIDYSGTTLGHSNGALSTQDWVNLGLGVAGFFYDVFNNERNWVAQQEAYNSNRQLQQLYYKLESNGLTNLARQYSELGLNPLAVSGNGTSYSQPSPMDSPQHGSLDFLTTLKLVDGLKTSKAERDLLESQALRQKTLAMAQSITNAKNYAQVEKWGFENGLTKAKIDKTIKETKRVMQLMDVTGYDFDLSKLNNQRFKDSTDKWVKLLETIAGFIVPKGVDLKTALSSPTTEDQRQKIFNANPMYIYKRQ